MTGDDHIRSAVLQLLDQLEAGDGPADGSDSSERLDLTSLDLVRLLVSVEEHFDIELDDVVMMNANFDTIDDVVDMVRASI